MSADRHPVWRESLKILLAVDDSKYSDAAIHQLIAQTSPRAAEVRVLHVIEPETIYPDGQTWRYPIPREGVAPERRKEAEGLVVRAAQRFRDAGFSVVTAIDVGDPKLAVIDAAAEWHADLIVLGSHGRKGLDRLLLGSVSEAVARNAPCSVEIARISKT